MDTVEIAKSIRNITKLQAEEDYKKLQELHPTEKDLTKRIGSKFVDYYTFHQRLFTRCSKRRNVNFYEFYEDPSKWMTLHSLSHYEKHISNKMEKGKTKEWSSFDFYSNWFHNPTSFRPVIAKYLYENYKPHTILDPTVGWGSRFISAMSVPNLHYIGYDTNISLIDHYLSIVQDLKVSNRVTLLFEDSSQADLSKYKYDMVFTSPPYYEKNKPIEIYEHMPLYENYNDWVNRFFNPVMSNAWTHLEQGGHFCINTNYKNYELLHKLFGDPFHKINIQNKTRHACKNNNVKCEYIYIWKK